MVNIGDKSITITIEVDSTGAVKAVNGLEQNLGKLKGSAENSSGGFSKLQASIVTLNQGINLAQSVVAGATQAFQALAGALDEAGRVEGVTAGFEAVQDAAGVLASDALARLQDATRGLVSDFDLMQQATQAAQLGLDPATYDEVAGAAVKLGRSLGVDALNAIQSVTTGIGRQSVQMLDNLGIIVKANDAYESFAASQGKTASELSETEKRIAFQTAALDALRKKAAETADIQETASTAATRLGVEVSNARAKVLEAISANEDLREAINNITEAISEIDFAELGRNIGRIIELALQVAEKVLPVLLDGFTALIREVRLFGETIDFITSGFNALDAYALAVQKIKDEENLARINAELLAKGFGKAFGPETQRQINTTSSNVAAVGTKAKEAADKAEEAFRRFSGSIDNVLEIDRLPSLTAEIEEAFSGDARNNANELADALLEIGKNAQEAGIELSEVSKRVKEINDLPVFGPGNEAGITEFGKQISNITVGFEEALGQAIANAFSSLASAIASGNSDSIRTSLGGVANSIGGVLGEELLGDTIGDNLGSIFGATIGTSLGGPLGTAIGATAGELAVDGLFSAFDSIFGGTNAGEEARQTVDRFIAEALDASRLRLVIDGELRELTDLTFAGNFTGGLFDNLVPEAQAAFQGVGVALEQLLGVSEEIGGQVGTVLANNVGGNLNNLQILVGELGVSFEEMGDAVEQAFLRGELAGGEAFAALQQIQKISQKGIPDALGATTQAFDNLIESGENGRLILDAIGDLGVEAIEKGIDSLAGLRQDLEASGKFSQTQIDQLFNALSFAGVSSLEQLEEAGVQTAIKVAARLSDIGFAFDNVGSDLGELVTGLNTLPDRKDIELNVRTNFDRNTQEAIDSGIFNQQFPGRAAIS